jgi:ankyrin repeat protein
METKGEEGMTALGKAARNGHEAIVKLLLEKGADPATKDDLMHPFWSDTEGEG